MTSNGELSSHRNDYGPAVIHYGDLQQGNVYNTYSSAETKIDFQDELLLTDPLIHRETLKSERGRRAPRTCEWIRENEYYQQWLSGNGQCLWIRGGPGTGKTMLSIFLTEELEKTKGITLLFFFCSNGDNDRNNAVSVLRGLAYQLLTKHPSLSNQVSSYFETPRITENTLSSQVVLWTMFRKLLQNPGLGPVFCVLDGLDECDEQSAGTLVRNLRAFYLEQRYMRSATRNFNLAILSRKVNGLDVFPQVRLDADNNDYINEDIKQLISTRTQEFVRLRGFDNSFRKKLQIFLLSRSEGTFLWISLAMYELLKCTTCTEVIDVLKTLPRGLPAMYSRMLRQINSSQRDIISSTLICVAMSLRPMTLEELRIAVSFLSNTSIFSIQAMRDQIMSCGAILQISDEQVKLVHQSARDYLLQDADSKRIPEFRIKVNKAHAWLARICLDYIEESDFQLKVLDIKDASVLQKWPLLQYAAMNWPEHAKRAFDASNIINFSRCFFREKSNTRQHWWQAYRDVNALQESSSLSSLDIASYLGIVALTWTILTTGNRIGAFNFQTVNGNKDGRPALVLAACQGHEATVQLLLENGADAKNNEAVVCAAAAGHEAILQLLLEKGADVKNSEAIIYAARGDYQTIVIILLEKGANINIKDEFGKTALSEAIKREHEAMVQLLLAGGANAKSCPGALSTAASAGHTSIVRLLLESGVDVNARHENDGFTALSAAASRGDKGMVKLLLDYGANMNMSEIDEEGKTALSAAAQQGHEAVVKLFVERGADTRDIYQALDWAELNGHENIVQLLKFAATSPLLRPQSTHMRRIHKGMVTHLAFGKVTDSKDSTALIPEKQGQELKCDDDDMKCSDLSSINTDMRESFISGLTDLLLNIVKGFPVDKSTRERIREVLPDLLEAFALKIGYNAPNQMHRDFMYFVQKYRHKISASFQDRHFEPENVLDKLASSCSKLSLDNAVGAWLDSLDHEQLEPESDESKILEYNQYRDENATNDKPRWTNERTNSINGRAESINGRTDATYGGTGSINGRNDSAEDNDGDLEQQETQEAARPWLIAYRDFVPKTEAYEWLLNRLQREFCLTSAKPSIMDALSLEITQSLRPVRKVGRKASNNTTYKVTFEVDWNIMAFLGKQQYTTELELADAMERTLTLTGSYQDSYITTCGQYINQVWPLTGGVLMQLVKNVVESSDGFLHSCDLRDGTTLSARIAGEKFTVEACGCIVSIADIGEQLAWLAAALRLSPHKEGAVCCSPYIDTTSIRNVPLGTQLPPPPGIIFKIGFNVEIHEDSTSLSGLCWHKLFMNPTIVKGYPIPSRSETGTGAEIPLNIMAGLARTQRVDYFKEMTVIKGFSVLLVPQKRSGNMIFWHLTYNKDGRHVSYLDNTKADMGHINHLDLEQSRHILGWCSEANLYAGSARAGYTIFNSSLPKPHKGCSLANIYVSPGRCIVDGPTFTLGTKDTPAHVSRSGYIPRLQWIATKLVLLWDEGEKRGWLVNGTTALLHIVRASLVHNSTDKFKSAFLFKEGDLHESATPFTADSAIDILINPENLALKLYREKDSFLLLESRIEYFYNILEKLIDHQADVAGMGGGKMTDKPRRYLEGWDFNDLAISRDPLYPRVATLEPHGKCWVDLIRAIHAVTLFGSGFGDLIKPSSADICEYWAEMPKQKYYIAACVSDLSQMIKDHENNNYKDNHVRLNEHVIWHTPTTLFSSCRCKGLLGKAHNDPVQALLPSTMSRSMLPRKFAIPLESPGAILFGHNSTFSWIYEDSGDPKEGKLATPKASDVDSCKDSGIGLDGESVEIGTSQSNHRILEYLSNDEIEIPLEDSASSLNNKTHSREEYTVGIICALPKELLAVRVLFDERHEGHENAPRDSNHYSLGRIGKHMVAALCLPSGEYGTTPAAGSTSNLTRSFPNISFCLLVGIGGGAPTEESDIRLGDVVVSLPTAKYPGVIQYDRGKQKENDIFERTGALQSPPWYLMTAISSLRSDPDLSSYPLQPYLDEISKRLPELGYQHPGQEHDQLFQTACPRCDMQEECVNRDSHTKTRKQRPTNHPKIHYGLIASGNCVIKDSQIRDKWAQEDGVLCFEMEAAGVMNLFPCLVIRGISDYADSSKNKLWQEYAAATAASYAKLLLSVVATSVKSYQTSDSKRRSSPAHENPEWQINKRRRLYQDSD